MPDPWESALTRWVEAGLLDDASVSRIRSWEGLQGGERSRWPARLALALGGILLSAGILLFVAAHWDAIAPWQRFVLVLLTVGGLHLSGALTAGRSETLSAALHASGTAALGGGVFLTGQIFNLEEHWPAGLLVWAAGAWTGWALLRQWPQFLLAAVITPAWLLSEWIFAVQHHPGQSVGAAGVLLLALVYLASEPGTHATPAVRRSLFWVGAIATIPAVLFVVASVHESRRITQGLPPSLLAIGWLGALGLPLGLAWRLRGRNAIASGFAAVWICVGLWVANGSEILLYLWAAGLSIGLVAWGVVDRRRERINLGVAGFALTVLAFYFSSVMDRLGRSASLIGVGLLFLGGGYALERARRRLVAGVEGSGA